jgi:hypothetical protein
VLILALLLLTSVLGGLLAVRQGRCSWGALPTALGRAAESVGLGVLFLAGNLGLGFLVTRMFGSLLGPGISVYSLEDPVLFAVSLLQGVTVRWWLDRP